MPILNKDQETINFVFKYSAVALIFILCFSAPVIADDLANETVQNQEEDSLDVFWILIFILMGLTSLSIVSFLIYRYRQFREDEAGKEQVLKQEIKSLTEEVNIQRAKGQVITDDLLEELNRAEMNIEEGNYELAEGHIEHVKKDLGISEDSEKD